MQNENKTPVEVIEYYKNMIFIPSPKGNIYFECNRTMDALEWGCIPVSIKFLGEDCYKYLYGDHPFIIGDKWSDVAQQMKDLINNPKKLRLKQIEVFNWYQNFKKELADDISYIVNGEFKKIKGVQFAYQRRVKKNIWLRWRFFKHFTLSVYWKRIIGQTPVSKQ
ncbi:MAG: hypothetical protein DI598_17340 [Pseudopedobacter saltans]|uniref:Exostosin GT47 domain-containing protein n=1 Tax=Pseudopedobacter saltans TaxID=151895 RepID=A0A2W5EJD0_9SPHI|nr:MAG: hypothetical protein DI598_17340 [Pseudopedobacter saltans]